MLLAAAPEASDGRAVTLGFRPEHLVLDGDGFASEIVVVEPTGAETHIVGRFGTQSVIGVFHDRIVRSPGEILNLTVPSRHLYFFDPASGRRLPH